MAKLLCLARFDYTFLFYSVKIFVIIFQGTIDYVYSLTFNINEYDKSCLLSKNTFEKGDKLVEMGENKWI